MLLRIPAVLTEQQLASMRAALGADDAPWVDGRVTAGHQGIQVKQNQQIEENTDLGRAQGAVILAALERDALFVSATLPHRVYPPMFNRHGEGMHFGNHVDGAIRRIPGSDRKMRTDLSATLFLVPPESYDGGELIIRTHAGSESFKLPAGDLIVYPSTAPHRVTPVTRGCRIASFFWIQSLVRDEGRRGLLFELDGTIQHLTARGADTDGLVALAGHYHNLLRLWSEP
jgi:PKHD-type hydroxylase